MPSQEIRTRSPWRGYNSFGRSCSGQSRPSRITGKNDLMRPRPRPMRSWRGAEQIRGTTIMKRYLDARLALFVLLAGGASIIAAHGSFLFFGYLVDLWLAYVFTAVVALGI